MSTKCRDNRKIYERSPCADLYSPFLWTCSANGLKTSESDIITMADVNEEEEEAQMQQYSGAGGTVINQQHVPVPHLCFYPVLFHKNDRGKKDENRERIRNVLQC